MPLIFSQSTKRDYISTAMDFHTRDNQACTLPSRSPRRSHLKPEHPSGAPNKLPRAGLGGAARGGAACGGAAGRGGLGQDGSPRRTVSLALQGIEDNRPGRLFGSTNKRNPMYVDRIGGPQRAIIRGTANDLRRSWLLTCGRTPICRYQTLLMQGMSGKTSQPVALQMT